MNTERGDGDVRKRARLRRNRRSRKNAPIDCRQVTSPEFGLKTVSVRRDVGRHEFYVFTFYRVVYNIRAHDEQLAYYLDGHVGLAA